MIRIGDKLRLKFDIAGQGIVATEHFGPRILGYRNSIVEVIDYDSGTNFYSVIDEKNTKMNILPHQFQQIFVIPDFEQMLPYQSGWYLYKTAFDVSPTYCKLDFRDGELQIASGDTGYPIDKMGSFWWLRVG